MNFWRHFTICREGWYYLFVLAFVVIGALLRDINLLVVVAGMLTGPLLFSVYCVLTTLRGVGVERRLPPHISAGDLLIVDLAVSNQKQRIASWAVTVVDQIRRGKRDRRRPAGRVVSLRRGGRNQCARL